MTHIIKNLFLSSLLFCIGSCSTYQQFKYITEEFEMPSKIFKAEYHQTWQAVVEVMRKYDITLKNLESGVIKTQWMDNTNEINFVDSFSKGEEVKAAKFKLILNVVKGFRSGKEVTKVTIYRRQLIEQDFLQGWQEIPSDGIQEKVLLYRVNRLVFIDAKLRAIDQAKQNKEVDF